MRDQPSLSATGKLSIPLAPYCDWITEVPYVPTNKPRKMADSTILVQGGSLRTWSYRSPSVEQVQVVLSTEGRPLEATTT